MPGIPPFVGVVPWDIAPQSVASLVPVQRVVNNIRQLRFEYDEMTQQELANRVECTRQTIIVLEKERYVPSLSLAFRIARVFDRTVEDVFEYSEDHDR